MVAHNIFAEMLHRVHRANTDLMAAGVLPTGIDLSRVTVEPPRDPTHGDMATNAAMVLAKEAGKKPRELAEAIAQRLRADELTDKVEVAGPGFINLTLKASAWVAALRNTVQLGAHYGESDLGEGRAVNVEYVSANPTGPMHVGHCRGAVFGDALANLLEFTGYKVTREYYVNDAGAQVDVLARSAYLALPRGARRRHRRHSGRALSRRLSQARRRGAGRGIWRCADRQARGRMAARRTRQSDRDDDGGGARRPRRAQHHARGVLSPSGR